MKLPCKPYNLKIFKYWPDYNINVRIRLTDTQAELWKILISRQQDLFSNLYPESSYWDPNQIKEHKAEKARSGFHFLEQTLSESTRSSTRKSRRSSLTTALMCPRAVSLYLWTISVGIAISLSRYILYREKRFTVRLKRRSINLVS